MAFTDPVELARQRLKEPDATALPSSDATAQRLFNDAIKAAQRTKIDAFHCRATLLTSMHQLNRAGGPRIQPGSSQPRQRWMSQWTRSHVFSAWPSAPR